MKNARRAKILEIVASREVETQEELAELLRQANILVTQATVSRDIRELGLVKVKGNRGKSRYAAPNTEREAPDKIANLFREAVLSVRSANNLVVVKTLPGGGSSAGLTVDRLCLPEVVGSIAGDDTLLVVAASNDDAEKVRKTLEDLLKEC